MIILLGILLLDFELAFLPALADVEGERRRRAQLNVKGLGADGDVIGRRAGRRHQRRRDDGDEFHFVFDFLLQTEKTEPTLLDVVISRFSSHLLLGRMDHRSRPDRNPPVPSSVLYHLVATTPPLGDSHRFRHGSRFDADKISTPVNFEMIWKI